MTTSKFIVSSRGRSVVCGGTSYLDAAVNALNHSGLPPSLNVIVAMLCSPIGLRCSAERGTVRAVSLVTL